jgi:hypothetical protein
MAKPRSVKKTPLGNLLSPPKKAKPKPVTVGPMGFRTHQRPEDAPHKI